MAYFKIRGYMKEKKFANTENIIPKIILDLYSERYSFKMILLLMGDSFMSFQFYNL